MSNASQFLPSLQELTQRMDQLVFAYQPAAGSFTYLNPALEEIWGRTRENLTNNLSLLLDTVHPEDRNHVLDMYKQLFNHQKVTAEFRIIHSDGTARWLLLHAYLIRQSQEDSNGQPSNSPEEEIVGYASNITSQKEYHDNLHKFADKKNSVLEILSHDLAGPLSSIQALAKHLSELIQPYENGDLNEIVQILTRTSQHGLQLIREFVDQEFLESSQVTLLKQRTNLAAKTRDIIDQFKSAQQQMNKTFQLHTSSENMLVAIDETKFMQAINNLLSNAIKFTRDDGIITVRIIEQKETVLLSVEDNGIGIPAHLQAGLFEKFTKARRPGLNGEPTFGLGMSIIKTIVEWHNGRMWFESQENQGTTFYIEIPKE
ncbi:MAG: PAS domain-containing sensor histidine kinase [Bacteroidota bacterium]